MNIAIFVILIIITLVIVIFNSSLNSKLSKIEDKVNQQASYLEEKMKRFSDDWRAIVSKQEEQQEEQQKQQEEQQKTVHKLKSEINSAQNEQLKNLTKQKEFIRNIEIRVVDIQDKVKAIDSNLSSLSTKIDIRGNNFDKLSKQITTELQSIINKQKEDSTNINGLSGKVKNINSLLSSHSEQTTRNHNELNDILSKLKSELQSLITSQFTAIHGEMQQSLHEDNIAYLERIDTYLQRIDSINQKYKEIAELTSHLNKTAEQTYGLMELRLISSLCNVNIIPPTNAEKKGEETPQESDNKNDIQHDSQTVGNKLMASSQKITDILATTTKMYTVEFQVTLDGTNNAQHSDDKLYVRIPDLDLTFGLTTKSAKSPYYWKREIETKNPILKWVFIRQNGKEVTKTDEYRINLVQYADKKKQCGDNRKNNST